VPEGHVMGVADLSVCPTAHPSVSAMWAKRKPLEKPRLV